MSEEEEEGKLFLCHLHAVIREERTRPERIAGSSIRREMDIELGVEEEEEEKRKCSRSIEEKIDTIERERCFSDNDVQMYKGKQRENISLSLREEDA